MLLVLFDRYAWKFKEFVENVWHFHSIHRSFSILNARADKSLPTWSCFLRIFVGTTAIIYSELFSLALPKFVMLMRSLDDAIWNMRSFLKALCKLFFINSIENSSICAFWCFELRALYKKWLTNLCRTFAWMHCFLFYFCHLAVDGCSSK